MYVYGCYSFFSKSMSKTDKGGHFQQAPVTKLKPAMLPYWKNYITPMRKYTYEHSGKHSHANIETHIDFWPINYTTQWLWMSYTDIMLLMMTLLSAKTWLGKFPLTNQSLSFRWTAVTRRKYSNTSGECSSQILVMRYTKLVMRYTNTSDEVHKY